MDFIIAFVKEHYKLISLVIAIVFHLVTLLVLICKRKVKVIDVFTQVLTRLPDFIAEAESKFAKGSEKYCFVFNRCVELLRGLTSLSGQQILSEYTTRIDTAIESILSTPQKKER